MLLPSKFLRVFVCLSVLLVAAQASQTAFSQGSKKDQERGYEFYVKGLFKTYDDDRNGLLDAEEIEKMRRKPDSKADANSDGEISQSEMLDQYLVKAKIKKTGRRTDSDSRFQNKETKKGIKKLEGTVTMICDGSKITLLGDPGDVASVESLLQKAVEEAGTVKPASESTVSLSVWIASTRGSNDMERLKGKSRKFVAAAMSKLAENSDVQIEEFHLDARLGQPIELTRGGQVPVIQGTTQTRGGQANQISTFEVGTTLNAEATRTGENVLIEFNIEKSTIEETDVVLSQQADETLFAKAVTQFKLSAEIECESDKACVVKSQENDRAWTLVFCADPSPMPSTDERVSLPKSGSRERGSSSRNRQRRSRD